MLDIHNLAVRFHTPTGLLQAVGGVSLNLKRGETLGLVGESGCGKTVTALAILRLLPCTAELSGEIRFADENLLRLSEERLRQVRGNRIAMVFQEPMTALNPVLTIGDQVAESLKLHRGLSTRQAWREAARALTPVGLPEPNRHLSQYPHQLSGGLRQRVLIAMALACAPDILIADEPTTALDVTIQSQILALLTKLKKDLGLAVLLITHNLGIVAQSADRVAVMYAGLIMETGSTIDLFQNPCHPYTQGLLASVPKLDFDQPPGGTLAGIPGQVPNLYQPPRGCFFRERCSHETPRCQEPPPWVEVEPNHRVLCWLCKNDQEFRNKSSRFK